MSAADKAVEPVRLFFEIERDDNPRLYDDLVKFKKGTRRVNRLRFLAHEGLMAERGCRAPLQEHDLVGAASDLSTASETNAVFDAVGLQEGEP